MKYLVLILLMVSFIPVVSAVCEDGQININSASLEELDKLVGIGNATARNIINTRNVKLFDSVDDLVRVSGIKDGKLKDIKAQGLACVDSDDSEEEEIANKPEVVEEVVEEEIKEEAVLESVLPLNNVEKKVEIISLNTKVAEDDTGLVYVSKNAKVVNYLPYGFAVFLIFVIGFLIWERF